jgi:hypothetical protein
MPARLRNISGHTWHNATNVPTVDGLLWQLGRLGRVLGNSCAILVCAVGVVGREGDELRLRKE